MSGLETIIATFIPAVFAFETLEPDFSKNSFWLSEPLEVYLTSCDYLTMPFIWSFLCVVYGVLQCCHDRISIGLWKRVKHKHYKLDLQVLAVKAIEACGEFVKILYCFVDFGTLASLWSFLETFRKPVVCSLVLQFQPWRASVPLKHTH